MTSTPQTSRRAPAAPLVRAWTLRLSVLALATLVACGGGQDSAMESVDEDRVALDNAPIDEKPPRVRYEAKHRLRAQLRLRAHDGVRHLIACEKIERHKAGVPGESERRMPGKKVDHVGSLITVNAAEGERAIIGRYAAP